MRPSPLRHPIAVLRNTLGLGQKEFGKLVGKSARTIQSLELHAHPLSEDLARTISQETGVAYAWLMRGNPRTQPWVEGPEKIPYIREHFERTRHWRSTLMTPSFSQIVGEQEARSILGNEAYEKSHRASDVKLAGWTDDLVRNIGTLLAAIRAAEIAGRSDIARYRFAAFSESMGIEFGQVVDDDFLSLYAAFLKSCRTNVRATKTVLAKTGPALRSPHIPRERWTGSEDDFVILLGTLTRLTFGLSDDADAAEFRSKVFNTETVQPKKTVSRSKRDKTRRI